MNIQNPNYFFNAVKTIDKGNGILYYLDYTYIPNENEKPQQDKVEMKVFSKFIELAPFTVSGSLIDDNSVTKTMVDSILVNELNQKISLKAVDKIRELGLINFNQNLKDTWNSDLLSGFEENSKKTYKRIKTKFRDNPFKWFLDLFKSDTVIAVDTTTKYQYAIQMLQRKILILSNFVASKNRRGNATSMIVNSRLAAILSDCPSFVYKPFDNKLEVNNLFNNIGSFAGISIIVNPYLKWDDTTITVYRQGNEDEPGLGLMMQSNYNSDSPFKVTVEDRKTVLEASIAIFEAGFCPHYNYITVPLDIPKDLI